MSPRLRKLPPLCGANSSPLYLRVVWRHRQWSVFLLAMARMVKMGTWLSPMATNHAYRISHGSASSHANHALQFASKFRRRCPSICRKGETRYQQTHRCVLDTWTHQRLRHSDTHLCLYGILYEKYEYMSPVSVGRSVGLPPHSPFSIICVVCYYFYYDQLEPG